MSFELPGTEPESEMDKEKTRAAVEAVMEKYRLYKGSTLDEREAQTTAAWSDSPKGYTGTTSDQTSNIAIYNVDSQEYRRKYCERVEKAVTRLPLKERTLITERYLNIDCDFDYVVYNQVLDPPIGETTYYKRKWEAFYKIALNLNIQVVKDNKGTENNLGNEKS